MKLNLFVLPLVISLLSGCVNNVNNSNDTEKSFVSLNDQLCNNGQSDGCSKLGFHYSYTDKNKAISYYIKGCELGDAASCSDGAYNAKKMHYDELSLQLNKKSCELNNHEACGDVGYFYSSNNQIKTAIKYYEKAFSISNDVIYKNIINDLKNRENLKNQELAKCKKGDGQACNFIGSWHSEFLKNDEDAKKAEKYLTKSCDLNNRFGCANLADLYRNGYASTGYIISKNPKKAFDLDVKACRLKNPSGCYDVGISYYNGYGVRQDKVQAKEFFGKACDYGEQKGCDLYKELNSLY